METSEIIVSCGAAVAAGLVVLNKYLPGKNNGKKTVLECDHHSVLCQDVAVIKNDVAWIKKMLEERYQ